MVSITEPIELITGSMFSGHMRMDLHCMDGPGSYIYPDGSTFRGTFEKGVFQGFGRLTLEAPYKIEIRGTFDNGRLVHIDKIFFADGLHITVPAEETMNLNLWTYCRDSDRRFLREQLFGILPVGPDSQLTSSQQARDIPLGAYDGEEGFYFPGSGFMTNIEPPLRRRRYITCEKETQWLCENCRYGRKPHQNLQLKKETCRDILLENFAATSYMDVACTCNAEKYNSTDCKRVFDPIDEEASLDDTSFIGSKSSNSNCSLNIESLRNSVLDIFNCS